jgi:hypothetical protein
MRKADAFRWSQMALCVLLLTACQQRTGPLDRGVELSPEVAKHAAALRKTNRVEGGTIGVVGSSSDIHAVYEKLRAAAGKEELVRLLHDKNPAVRVYAFWGLYEKFPQSNWFDHLMGRLTDTQHVLYQFGCIEQNLAVADLLLQWSWQYLDKTQLQQVGDWLVENPNNLQARYRIFRDFSPKPKHHAAVRKLAQEGAKGSLQALAGFRDPADLPIIAKYLNANNGDALKAAELFPHPKLFSSLPAMHEVFLDLDDGYHGNMDEYYRAVAAFGGPQARKILGSVLDIPETRLNREYPLTAAYRAIIVYRKDYPELLMRFFEYWPMPYLAHSGTLEDAFQEDRILQQLLKANRQRMLVALRAQFVRKDFHGHSEMTLRAMVRMLFMELKPDEAFAVINEGLARADCHQLPVLCKYVTTYKFRNAAPVLLERLVSTKNGVVQRTAARTLLAYDRQDIRDKIQDLLRQGKVPENNWGRQAVEDLLKEAVKQSRG